MANLESRSHLHFVRDESIGNVLQPRLDQTPCTPRLAIPKREESKTHTTHSAKCGAYNKIYNTSDPYTKIKSTQCDASQRFIYYGYYCYSLRQGIITTTSLKFHPPPPPLHHPPHVNSNNNNPFPDQIKSQYKIPTSHTG